MIEWQIQRILQSNIEKLVLATSNEKSDNELANIVTNLGIEVHRGPLDDVLERFLQVLKRYETTNFIRLTGDCPLIMPEIINEMMKSYDFEDFDYYTNSIRRTFPDGLDVEIVKSKALRKLSGVRLSLKEREHVTVGFHTRDREFKTGYHMQEVDLSDLRWTVDTQVDLDFVRNVFKKFEGREISFNYSDLLKLLEIDVGEK